MKQHVTQFLFNVQRVVLHQRVTQFVGLLNGVGTQALISLLAVPGALLAQVIQHIQQAPESCHLLFSRMYSHFTLRFQSLNI